MVIYDNKNNQNKEPLMKDLQPGMQLESIIYEKVMGNSPRKGYEVSCGIPHYSRDISAAWEVVEKIKDKDFSLEYYKVNGDWGCQFSDVNNRVHCDTAPHAICLAALKATTKAKEE